MADYFHIIRFVFGLILVRLIPPSLYGAKWERASRLGCGGQLTFGRFSLSTAAEDGDRDLRAAEDHHIHHRGDKTETLLLLLLLLDQKQFSLFGTNWVYWRWKLFFSFTAAKQKIVIKNLINSLSARGQTEYLREGFRGRSSTGSSSWRGGRRRRRFSTCCSFMGRTAAHRQQQLSVWWNLSKRVLHRWFVRLNTFELLCSCFLTQTVSSLKLGVVQPAVQIH